MFLGLFLQLEAGKWIPSAPALHLVIGKHVKSETNQSIVKKKNVEEMVFADVTEDSRSLRFLPSTT